MTIHLVCLDGTGQKRPQAHLTNIALIFDVLGGVVVDGGNGSWETTLTQGAGPHVFPATATAGQPDFAIDDSIHQRWGRTVTVLPQGAPGPYKSTGLMGANPLYTPS
jgi:hypothetical protein